MYISIRREAFHYWCDKKNRLRSELNEAVSAGFRCRSSRNLKLKRIKTIVKILIFCIYFVFFWLSFGLFSSFYLGRLQLVVPLNQITFRKHFDGIRIDSKQPQILHEEAILAVIKHNRVCFCQNN